MAGSGAMNMKSFYAPLQAQESTFLNIPSEIRNSIYDAVCEGSTEVTLCYRSKRRIKPLDHPLTRACRQTRDEFRRVWENSGPNQATTVVFAINNLDIGDMGKIREWLAALPLPRENKPRTYVMRFFIDNFLERSIQQFRGKYSQVSEKAGDIKFEYDIALSTGNLDICNTRRVMELYGLDGLEDLQETFEKAVKIHKSKQAELRRIRAKTRSTAFEALVEEDD